MILSAFSNDRKSLTLSEIADMTGLDLNTVRRLLNTLETNDYVHYDAQKRRFALGTAILVLYPAVQFGSAFREASAPVLSRLSAHTGTTSFAWVFLKGQAQCVERVRGSEAPFDMPWTKVGMRLPINSGAGPRVIMGHLSATMRDQALTGATGRTTPLSRTDRSVLSADADTIRAQGWEFAAEDYVVGMSALAAPVFTPSGDFVGSVSITAAAHRFALTGSRPPHLDALLDAAAEIGWLMRLDG